MLALDRPIRTARLRLEPLTRPLADAAQRGATAFADALDADIPDEWIGNGNHLAALARRRSWALDTPTHAVVIHRADERVIGDIRFEPVSGVPDTLELGYGIAAAYRRKGYAYEASKAILDYQFDHAGVQRVIAGCDMRNAASVRTLRKLGFWLDGARRGQAFWWIMTSETRDAQS